jgi:hypothetical protein
MKCPKCNRDLTVSETRAMSIGIRRRRACTSIACGHRVTTVEVIVHEGIGVHGSRWSDGVVLIVPKAAVEDLQAALAVVSANITRQHEQNQARPTAKDADQPDDLGEETGRG